MAAPLIPPGTIVAFAGPLERIPEGWEICHGQQKSPGDPKYAELFKHIGSIWGGNGVTTFYLPNLQGVFLRGVSAQDFSFQSKADAEGRTAPRPDLDEKEKGFSGNNVGSFQNDALQGHGHNFTLKVSESHEKSGSVTQGKGKDVKSFNDAFQVANHQVIEVEGFGSPRVSIETRPVNAHVHYIIKL